MGVIALGRYLVVWVDDILVVPVAGGGERIAKVKGHLATKFDVRRPDSGVEGNVLLRHGADA